MVVNALARWEDLEDAFGPRMPWFYVATGLPVWTALTPGYARALVENEVSHSYVAHPTMPSIGEQIRRVRGGARHGLVIRWMLRNNLVDCENWICDWTCLGTPLVRWKLIPISSCPF